MLSRFKGFSLQGDILFKRVVELTQVIKNKSVFLLGPRQTGKSTYLKKLLNESALYIDLLQAKTFQNIASDPEAFPAAVKRFVRTSNSNTSQNAIVVVDEVQKLPALLDEVHRLIEECPQLRFVLTGSSARKIKSGAANLLGGRARLQRMHPLCRNELQHSDENKGPYSWKDLILRSALPSLFLSVDYEEDCAAYTDLYLREEIQQEALVRRMPEFTRFLAVAAGANGHQIVFEKWAARAGISAKVCKSYFEILSDTMLGELLPSFKETQKRQSMSAPKFYFFDIGLARYLQGRTHADALSQGEDLETYLLHEIKCYRDYKRQRFDISYWRSKNQSEVDFVLSKGTKHVAIEVKTTRRLTGRDFSGLKALDEEKLDLRKILVNPWVISQDRDEGIEVLSVDDFLDELWKGAIV